MSTPDDQPASVAASEPRLHLIAEAGTNHGGKRDTANALVEAARQAGADSVKFQLIYPEGLYLPEFLTDGRYVPNEVFQKRRAAMLSDDDWRRVAAHCAEHELPFSASVFDRRGLDLLEELDAPYIKIASCDLNHLPFLQEAASRGRRLILSTGMAALAEVERSVTAIQRIGRVDLVLMHCVSVYPCPAERTNLSFIDELKRTFGLPVGFSDHTESSLASAIAVAKGVAWIEKHFTLDRKASGFDHAYAMEPAMLTAYIADVRASEAACRPQPEKVQPAEATVKQRARRGLYAARDIAPGEVVRERDVLIVRPEGPIAPPEAVRVYGAKAARGFRRLEPITWEGLAA
jgi:sialic acid synthase SpsE